MANKFTRRFQNMDRAGGNHQAQNVQGILQEGQKSYLQTIDNKLGTQHAGNAFTKRFSHIKLPVQGKPTTKTIKPTK